MIPLLTYQTASLGGVGTIFGFDKFNIGFGTLGNILILIMAIAFVVAIICAGVGLWVWKRMYNQKASIWAKISGVPQEIAVFPARWIKVGQAGDRLLYISKLKKYEYPKLMVGKNKWNFWRREKDGELINFEFDDFDEKMRKMKIKFIDTDVRMQRLGIAKNLDQRLQKKKNWMEIVTQIAYIVVFILIFIALVVLFSKLINVAESMDTMAQSIGRVATSVDNLVSKSQANGLSPANNPQSEVSGLVPVEDGGGG